MKKIRVKEELIYVIAIILLSFAVNVMAAADFGMSMIVSPAYIISLKCDYLTYGQAEYLTAGIVFVIFCIVMKQCRAVYFISFLTGILYATMADIWTAVIPFFHSPEVYAFPVRLMCFISGLLLSALAIALFYETYLYPQIYDFFVKEVSKKYGVPLSTFKTGFDCTFLVISAGLSLVLFHGFKGIGFGTVIMAACNGTLIGRFRQVFEKHFTCEPVFTALKEHL